MPIVVSSKIDSAHVQLEGVGVLQASLLLMKSLNKTDSHFLFVMCSLFPKATI